MQLPPEGRDRADRLLHGIVGRLAPEQAREVLGGDLPPPRPLGVRAADLPDDDKLPLFARATAEPATKDQAPAAAPPAAGQQVAAAPPQDPLGQKGGILEGGGGKGIGGGIGGGAAIGTGIAVGQTVGDAVDKTKQWLEGLWTGGPGQGQNTTTPPPKLPTTTQGPDTSKPQQPPNLPNIPPKPLPPGPPPSTPQKPPVQESTYPGRPAEPVPPMGPVEIKDRREVDLSTGKPHDHAYKGTRKIDNKKVLESIDEVVFGTGKMNGADKKAANIEAKGNQSTAKADQLKIAEAMGKEAADIEEKDGVLTVRNGNTSAIVRPDSDSRPTLEIQVRDKNDEVVYRVKRRYID